MFQKSLGSVLLLLSRPGEVCEMSQAEERCNYAAQSSGDGRQCDEDIFEVKTMAMS